MKDIHNKEWIDSLTDDLENRITNLNNFVISVFTKRLKVIAEKMKKGEAEQKTASEYALEDLAKIKKELSKTKKYSKREIDNIFNKLAAANVDFANDYYEYRNMPKIEDYTKNPALKPLVEDMKKTTQEGVRNISGTNAIGIRDINGKLRTVRAEYIRIIDKAVEAVKLGEEDFYFVMQKEVGNLVDSGLRTVEFDTGYTRRLDSQVRMNLQDGIRALNQQMQEQVGKEFDADGWEISVHALCAPDHIDIQGKQYTKEEYEKLNKRLERPIGQMNCRHFATPIIIGVSKPVYSKEELKQYKDRSNEKVKYKDKEITRYEASQVQRRYETAIRDAKLKQKSYSEYGDEKNALKYKNNVRKLTADYTRFSKSVGLTVRMNRT